MTKTTDTLREAAARAAREECDSYRVRAEDLKRKYNDPNLQIAALKSRSDDAGRMERVRDKEKIRQFLLANIGRIIESHKLQKKNKNPNRRKQ